MTIFEIQLCLAAGLIISCLFFGMVMNRIDKLEASNKKNRDVLSSYVNELQSESIKNEALFERRIRILEQEKAEEQ